MRFTGFPPIYPWFFKSAWFRLKPKSKTIYLTFDDGPTPEITHQVLDLLQKHQAKATFFVIGHNIKGNEDLIERIISEGHGIGNHTFHHKKGFKISTKEMINELKMCDQALGFSPKLFRPPYGQLTLSQYLNIRHLKQIVLWSKVSYDFDATAPHTHILDSYHFVSGDVIVFHDSVKAAQPMFNMLSQVFNKLSDWHFDSLPESRPQ